jgi:BirA family transcriptional regulator, biotin operon repressor / biotin---[acetyl-CoA-carboxylase] ligase
MTESLRAEQVRESVLAGSMLWSRVSVVAETGSTNADLVEAARAGAAEGTVLVAEQQNAGRGRLGRQWHSAPGAALTFSVLLRPAAVQPAARSWLPLLTGVAVAAGVRGETGLDVCLKWPNDVVAAGGDGPGGLGKLAGILAEQAGDAIIVGIGLNVEATPVLAAVGAPAAGAPAALAPASLADLGATGIDRASLLGAILREFEHWYLRWAGGTAPGGTAPGDAAASGLRAEYLRSCSTVGREVRVELPGGTFLSGRACDVDASGRLLVAGPDGVEAVSAGDVIHVR